ncbi:ArsR/SmtB family transcription factor [Ructibacterium gallinarum]|uniref:Helix-turn-helix transcriptional regulator n=1 Tax=Ructibacterium gallinarum TaxID=2779355 RepID=A0A9D5LZD5_9FIRM|nr:metalloregulator ArsR/SmtB family transcription factor [Ructibacterium gallinarum]MBE5039306.1 helix-turn-helix transcriptional regulator [Ructibacterium gallinarum]
MEKRAEHGDFLRIHDETVKNVMEAVPADQTLYELAELFKVFGDFTRIKIMSLLLEAELCVGDMAQLMGMSQNAVSHQLRVLKNSELVKFRREGKVIFYSLADSHVKRIISQGLEHVNE